MDLRLQSLKNVVPLSVKVAEASAERKTYIHVEYVPYFWLLSWRSDDEKYVTPIDKVYKSLVNGSEDNVVSFYQMIMEEG